MPARSRAGRKRPRPRRPPTSFSRDRHVLYEASVQGVYYDLDFFERVYRHLRGRTFRLLREDFCGTASLAAAWALRRPANLAWGVDLDPAVLAWAKRHRLARLRPEVARRVVLQRADVRDVTRPRVDVVAALNFSYWVFKQRDELLDYFRTVRRSLRPRGLFFTAVFGGTESMGTLIEKRRIAASRAVDGSHVPAFGYQWEHARFNPVDHHLLCHIHFRLWDGTWMRKAFSYDWRLWTPPELREVMAEAGFRSSTVYVEGWNDKENKPDGHYRLKRDFDNQEGWLAYVVGAV